jgi:hypothetical protein
MKRKGILGAEGETVPWMGLRAEICPGLTAEHLELLVAKQREEVCDPNGPLLSGGPLGLQPRNQEQVQAGARVRLACKVSSTLGRPTVLCRVRFSTTESPPGELRSSAFTTTAGDNGTSATWTLSRTWEGLVLISHLRLALGLTPWLQERPEAFERAANHFKT